MPVGPTVQSSYGFAIAAENAQLEREIEQLQQQRQLMQASNDQIAPIAERYRLAVQAARARLDKAESAYTLADMQTRARIRMEQPSEALQKLWYEEGTISQARERQAAKEQLTGAELALGQAVQNRRALEALEASAPARRAAAEQRYLAELDTIDQELRQARQRCAQ